MQILERPRPIAAATPAPHATAILAISLVSYFMIGLDNSVILTGIPQLTASLHLEAEGVAWVQDAYTVVFGGLLLLGARAGDLFGRRRMLSIGLGIFGVASLLVGLAPTGELLIGARAVQGVGAALIAPSTLALIQATFPPGPHRTRAITAYGATAGIGVSLGLIIGGVLAQLVSWRAGFLINIPVAAVMIAMVLRYIGPQEPVRGRLDLIGAATSTLGVGAVIVGVIQIGSAGAGSPQVLVPVLAGLVLLAVFVIDERLAPQPVLPLRLFRSRERSGAAVARLLFAATILGTMFFVARYAHDALGMSPLIAGVAFLPLTLAQFGAALAVPALTRRLGNGVLVVAGMTLVLAGMLWLSQVGGHYLPGLAGPLLLLGIGQGIGFGPLTAAGLADVDEADTGAASGLVNTVHQVGATVGVAVMTVGFAQGTGTLDSFDGAFRLGVVFAAGALAAAVIAVLPRRRR